jgi:hypothetical protein
VALAQPIDFVGDVRDHGGHRLRTVKPLHQAASASVIVGISDEGRGGGPPQLAPLRACAEHRDEVMPAPPGARNVFIEASHTGRLLVCIANNAALCAARCAYCEDLTADTSER